MIKSLPNQYPSNPTCTSYKDKCSDPPSFLLEKVQAMFGNRQAQAAPLREDQDSSVLNPEPTEELATASNSWKQSLWKPCSEQQHLRLRSDLSASANAEAPGPEIPTELKQTSQENSSASSKPLSRRPLPRAPAAGDPPKREPPFERPGSSRKGPRLKFTIHVQPRPAPPGALGQLHSRVHLPPAPSNGAPPARTCTLAAERFRRRP